MWAGCGLHGAEPDLMPAERSGIHDALSVVLICLDDDDNGAFQEAGCSSTGLEGQAGIVNEVALVGSERNY